MQTHYTPNLRYDCQQDALTYAAPACQSFVGEPLEQLVSAQILQVVTPASLQLSRRAAEQTERERHALDRQWQLRLERAHQDTDRAFRQFNAVEPENRLVARTLEGVWEKALLSERSLQEEYHRFQQTQPTRLSAAERAQIESLAHDLPALWQSPQTAVADKREVVRLLLQCVKVWTSASSDEMKVELHWTGGTMTEHHLTRPVQSWSQRTDAAALLQRMRQWRAAGWTSARIAEELNATGQRPLRGTSFTAAAVRQLLKRTANGGKARQRRRSKRNPAASSEPPR
jgi:hypothetical protein